MKSTAQHVQHVRSSRIHVFAVGMPQNAFLVKFAKRLIRSVRTNVQIRNQKNVQMDKNFKKKKIRISNALLNILVILIHLQPIHPQLIHPQLIHPQLIHHQPMSPQYNHQHKDVALNLWENVTVHQLDVRKAQDVFFESLNPR